MAFYWDFLKTCQLLTDKFADSYRNLWVPFHCYIDVN